MHDFDAALQKANEWVHEMATELGTADAHRGHTALRVGLHALRDRLGVAEVVQLGAQLPLVIRGLYYEGWNPSGKPVRVRRAEEFLELIDERAPLGLGFESQAVASALFRLLTHRLSPGEAEGLRHVLPRSISQLWANAAGAA
jgi:uncharacterized protein (DUF2267 family)